MYRFAGRVASSYQLPSIDAKEAVKMSYYPGPSEPELMQLRFRMAAHLGAFSDIKLRDSIGREVRLLLTHQQKSAIVAAYNAAPSAQDGSSNRHSRDRSLSSRVARSKRAKFTRLTFDFD